MKSRILFCSVIALMAAGTVARASTYTVYNNETNFDANVSGSSTVNFVGIADPNGFAGFTSGTSIGGVTFSNGPTGPGNGLFVVGENFYGFGKPALSVQGSQDNVDNGQNEDLQIALPGAETALGFNFIADPGTITITLSDGTVFTVNLADTPTFGFFGVTTTSSITGVGITQPSSLLDLSVNLVDVTYGTASPTGPSPVPEPGSLMLVGTGLVGFAGSLRKKCTNRF